MTTAKRHNTNASAHACVKTTQKIEVAMIVIHDMHNANSDTFLTTTWNVTGAIKVKNKRSEAIPCVDAKGLHPCKSNKVVPCGHGPASTRRINNRHRTKIPVKRTISSIRNGNFSKAVSIRSFRTIRAEKNDNTCGIRMILKPTHEIINKTIITTSNVSLIFPTVLHKQNITNG